MSDTYNTLIYKLDQFIRKYYKNQLLKGAMLCLSFLLIFFLIIVVFEYFTYSNTVVRTILFYLYLILNLLVIARLVVLPLLKLYKIGKIITYEQAATIIGKHFGEVSDKLLNTLQLQKIAGENPDNIGIINASIDQKIKKLKPIPFSMAVDFRINRKYLKYLAPPLLIIIIFLFTAPSVVTGPTERLINYSQFYEKQAPFEFILLNNTLKGIQQEDYRLDLKLSGEQIPAEVFIVYNNNEYKLTRENNVKFNYVLKNLQKSMRFYFIADGYKSKEYQLQVVPRPIVLNIEISLDYPDYTGKKDETIKNSGDISVPYGTKAEWQIKTMDTRNIVFGFADKKEKINNKSKDYFTFSKTLFLSQEYSIKTINEYIENNDSLAYAINVIRDEYPQVEVREYRDSVYDTHLYFKGLVKDDYGFTKLNFYYRVNEEEKQGKQIFVSIPVNKNITQDEFFHYLDVSSLGVGPGDELEYFFEIWDNDAVSGPKSTRSQKLFFKIPTIEEIQNEAKEKNEQIKESLEDVLKEMQLLEKELDDIDKKLLDKKALNWHEKKQIEDLLKRQQDLQKKVEDIKDMNLENNIKQQQFKDIDENILQKQQQLEELFNKLMTDEMKELIRQLQEMMDKIDKNKMDEMLDKMKLDNKDLEKEIERNLELFKELEFEKQLSDLVEKLKDLAEEQKKLAEETSSEKNVSEETKQKQEEINGKFQEIKEEIDDLNKKNSELEEPKDMINTEESENKIQEQLDKSSQQLQKNKGKDASGAQQEASEQMEELSEDLDAMQQEMMQEEYAEDVNSLRAILENLLKVSFDQEELMKELGKISINDPQYVKLMDKQKKLDDDLGMIEDSLYALSKRQSMIEPFVNKEISDINANVKKILDALHNRNTQVAQKWQQYVMTSVNNLALLLAESLEQMMQQMQSMANKSCKGGQCKKPGQGKPSASSLKKMQEELNNKMESLKKQMENGQKNGSEGQGNYSEQLAKLAAEQEALRRMLQQYGE